MRYAKRTDANHTSVIAALLRAGVDVLDLRDSGKGVTDIITHCRNRTVFIEIKRDGKASLKKTQIKFLSQWSGHCGIARNEEEAIALATDPVNNALTDPQKAKLAAYHATMTGKEVRLSTVEKVINENSNDAPER